MNEDLTLAEYLWRWALVLACGLGALACWTLALFIAWMRGWFIPSAWREGLRRAWAQTRGLWS